jgi:hypothetical protein
MSNNLKPPVLNNPSEKQFVQINDEIIMDETVDDGNEKNNSKSGSNNDRW